MLLGIIIVYSILFGFLILTCYNKKYEKFHPQFKFLNSLGFIITAYIMGVLSGNILFMLQMLPGFALCLCGDVLLALDDVKKTGRLFLFGLSSFLAAHIAFLIVFHMIVPIGLHDFVFPVIMALITWFLTRMRGMDIKGMQIPVILYSFFVSMLLSKAVSMGFALGFSTQIKMFCVGAFLFLLSDLILLFIVFYEKQYFLNRFINLLTYYYGLLILALSIYY